MAAGGDGDGPGLYAHVPFCRRRCGYCAFVSEEFDEARAGRYLDALEREFTARAAGKRFATVFVGGGTPTSLGTALLSRLLAILRPAIAGAGEVSLEANPGGFGGEIARVARDGGVNRISFGAQTFRPEGLRALDRRRNPDDPARALAAARAAGVPRLGLDLIAGWPGQTLASWRADLDAATATGVEHISCYGLSIEPGTRLAARVAAGELAPPDEDFDRGCWDMAGEILTAAGCPRYEISNHARPGAACRHNLNYWTGGEYLGLGPAAHSHENGRRYANTADLDLYSRAWEDGDGSGARTFEECLPPEAKARETLTVWLRLVDGVDAAAFRARTGYDLRALLGPALPALLAADALRWSADGRRLALTPTALPVADAVLCDLVGDSQPPEWALDTGT